MADEPQSKMQQKITDNLNDLIDKVINDRKRHYLENPRELPERKDVDSIISKWANTNAMIAGAAGLVPGPWGMLAAAPEIIAVIRNQTTMIFDLCIAFGQHRHVRPELVIGILMSSMGSGGTSLIAVQGGKLLVKRASLRVMQKVVAMLGGKVTQQLLKSMVGKWLPVVGAAAMAAWARYTTKKLGEQASELLTKEIVDGGAVDEVDASGGEASTPTPASNAEVPSASSVYFGGAAVSRGVSVEAAKIRVLINVMLADQEAAPAEVNFIQQLIECAEVSDAERSALQQILASRKRAEVDYTAFATPEDRAGLLFAAVVLAKRDGQIHLAERLYIKQLARHLEFSESDVNAAFDAEMPDGSVPSTPVRIPWGVQSCVDDPEFGIPVDLSISGQITVLGVWQEAVSWVAEQAAHFAVDALARSTTSIALAWSQTAELAASVQDQMDSLLRPHQMHALAVEHVEIELTPQSMAALQRASM